MNLTLPEIQAELDRVTYKPGWTLTVTEHPYEGLRYRIVAVGLPDAYQPGQTINIGVDGFLPPIPDTAYLHQWLAWRLGRIESHEMREFLRVDGVAVFDPHREAET